MKTWRSVVSAMPATTSWRATPLPQSTTYRTSSITTACAVLPRPTRGRGPPPVASMTSRVRFVIVRLCARTLPPNATTASAPAPTSTSRRDSKVAGMRRILSLTMSRTRSVPDLDGHRPRGADGRLRARHGDRLGPDGPGTVGSGCNAHALRWRRCWHGEIPPPVRATTLATGERARNDEPRRGELAVDVEPVLPRGVERAVTRHTRGGEPLGQLLDGRRGEPEALGVAHEPRTLQHDVAQLALDCVHLRRAAATQRCCGTRGSRLQRDRAHLGPRPPGDERRHHVARDATEHGGLGNTIAAEAVRAMNAAGVLAGGEQAFHRRAAVGIDDDAAHHEVRGRPDLDGSAREVPAKVAASTHHAAKVALDHLGAQVRDVDPHAAVGRAAALGHLQKRCARDEVARGALETHGIVALHEALATAVT